MTLRTYHLAPIALVLASMSVAQAANATLAADIAQDPSLLRSDHTLRQLRTCDPASYHDVMAAIVRDPRQDWDLRARALTFTGHPLPTKLTADFVSAFDAVEVATSPTGAATFNLLGEWLRRSAEPATQIAAVITPQRDSTGSAPLLAALAGKPLHLYLRWLDDSGFALHDEEIATLANTEDQLTRQLLCWMVGRDHRHEMTQFLVDQIASDYPSTARGKADRVLLAALTVGIGEMIRQAVPTSRWLEDDATPKGMALESLAVLIPQGLSLDATSPIVESLFQAASENAPGKNKGQWMLSIAILDFLRQRRVPLAGKADVAVAGLARQVLRKRGPLAAFVAAERLHREAGVPWPALSTEDQTTIWGQCFKTLNAPFLGAVVRVLPDKEHQQALQDHLLGQAEQASRGTLHVVRCWGADIEGPGDWALAVAELGLVEAIPTIETILSGTWNDEAAISLTRLGPQGARALARFLSTPEAHRLDRETLEQTLRACATSLPAEEWNELEGLLERDPYFEKILRGVVSQPSSR